MSGLEDALGELGRQAVVAVAEHAGRELGSALVQALTKRLGPSFVRGEVDRFEAARVAADAIERQRFGSDE